jgi:ligand-binding sensor domain-containing protein
VGINGKGVARLDADRERFRTFDTVNSTCQGQFWALAYVDDALWIGTNNHGVCRLARTAACASTPMTRRSRGLPSNSIFTSLVDAQGRLWMGTEAGVARWNGSGFEPVAARELGTLSVLRLSRDAEGSIWVGSQNDGLYRIDGQDRVSRPRWADSAQLRSALVLADRQGGYWAGTSDGLLRGDAAALRRLEGDRGSGFLTAHSGVLDLLQDHEGGLWVALLTQGLAYLPPDWRRFSIWNQLDGKPLDSQYLLSAASDGKNYYVGSARGCTSWMRRAPCACWPATGSSAAAWCGRCCRARTGACGWGAAAASPSTIRPPARCAICGSMAVPTCASAST